MDNKRILSMREGDYLSQHPERNDGVVCIRIISSADRTWSAVADSSYNSPSGAFLTTEGDYPVDLYYSRTDINGSAILEKSTCPDRDSLLESLNWIGKCGWSIETLWNFNAERPLSKELDVIFTASYERRCEMLKKAADEMFGVISEDITENEPKASLDVQIRNTGSRTSSYSSKNLDFER